MPKRSGEPTAETKLTSGNETASRGRGSEHDVNVTAFSVFQQTIGEVPKTGSTEKNRFRDAGAIRRDEGQ